MLVNLYVLQILIEQTVSKFGHIDCLINNAGSRKYIAAFKHFRLDKN